MIIATHNKASFFLAQINYITVKYDDINTTTNQDMANNLDIVFDKCKANNKIYKFQKKDSIIYLFSTKERKRKGQILKLFETNIKKNDIVKNINVAALMKREFYEYLEKNIEIEIKNTDSSDDLYSGNDIRFMNDRSVWHEWQHEIYDMLFYQNISAEGEQDQVRKPHDREVVFVYCPHGNTGKSLFWKWLQHKVQDKNILGRLTIGSSQQLKAALCKIPHRQIYVCDIPRTISTEENNRMSSLISTIESLKDGVLLNVMYGENTAILMDRPHIIISSNFLIDPNMLSRDRLKILQISKDKKLINITEKTKKSFDRINRDTQKKPFANV